MLVKPADLPAAEDVRPSPALDNLTNWKLKNSKAMPDEAETSAFLANHAPSFVEGVKNVLSKIGGRRPRPTT